MAGVARPQVFAFHHLGGMYPGPIYDEASGASPALWWFRLCTLLYAAGCLGLARRSSWILAFLPALALSTQASRLHWRATDSLLDEELGGLEKTEHLVLHFPREKKPEERVLLARDAEVQWRAVREFLGAGGGGIHVWFFRSAEEKRRLIGAADTSFTKPWLRQIHTNDEPAPHHLLRHELVHAVGADVAGGPWKVPGGLVPQMAFVEGIAVAGDWPPGELTVHEETRAMKELGRLPDMARLFRPGSFYGESSAVAYTAAGSFVRFLWETRGARFVQDAYAGRAPLGDLPALAAEHARFLDRLPRNARAVALLEQRFAAPAIVRKRCAHEVAGLLREAAAAPPARAVALWGRCAALEPDDPGFLIALRRAQAAAGDPDGARATQDRILSHPKLSKPQRALVLTEAGDATWRAGDATQALFLYGQAAALPQGEAAERALEARRIGASDAKTWPALRRLLADNDTGPDVLLALRDLDLARPREGLFAYLIAKQLQNRGAWPECGRYAQGALSRELPGPLFVAEALRMRGIAAWHAGETAPARAAFERLGQDAPPGRALEAQRWLDRL